MMAAFTASRHFLHSHTRGVLHSLAPSCCGCVDQFAARGSRTSPAHDAWLCAHEDVGSRDYDQQRQQTVGRTMQTVGINRRSLSHDKRQTTFGSHQFECVRIGREQHVPDSIACTQNPPSRVGESTLFPCCPQLPSHTLSKEKTHLLTLLLQNRLDHFNILLQDLWHIHDLLPDLQPDDA